MMWRDIRSLVDRSKMFLAWLVAIAALASISLNYKPDTQSFVGFLESRQYTVSSKSAGSISAMYVTLGQRVKRDEVLLEVTNHIIPAKIAALKHQLLEEQARAEAMKQIYQSGAKGELSGDRPVVMKRLDILINSLREQVDLKQKELNDLTIKAPIDGVVNLILTKVGENVSPFSPIILIDDPSHRSIKGYIHESIPHNPKIGQEFTAQSIHNKNNEVQAKVLSISQRITVFPDRLQPADPAAQLYYGQEVVLQPLSGDAFKLGELLVIIDPKQPNSLSEWLKATFLRFDRTSRP